MLERNEWDFGRGAKRIEDWERSACLVYEYGRESPTICRVVADYRKIEAQFRKRLKEEISGYESNLRDKETALRKKFRGNRQAKALAAVKMARKELKEEERDRLYRFLDNRDVEFREAFDWPEEASLLVKSPEELEEYFQQTAKPADWRVIFDFLASGFAGRVVLNPTVFPKRPWLSLSESKKREIVARAEDVTESLIECLPEGKYKDRAPSGIFRDEFGEEMTLKINWRLGSNDDIAKEFLSLLRKERPKDMPSPGRPGVSKRTDIAAYFRRIAVMRLRKAGESFKGAEEIVCPPLKRKGLARQKTEQSFDELIFPLYESDKRANEHIYRVRKDIVRLFGIVIPSGEKPRSYPFGARGGKA